MAESTSCCGCGDVIAALAREHAGPLVAVVRREGVGPADALDIVQDAFRTLLARPDLERLRTRKDDVARLLTVIARNAARNLRRRHHHARPHVDVEEVSLAATGPAPSDALERTAVKEQLGTCMAALGEVHRNVVTLRVLEELSGDDVAATLGLSPGHVAVLLHRAKKQLERCMQAG